MKLKMKAKKKLGQAGLLMRTKRWQMPLMRCFECDVIYCGWGRTTVVLQ
jgi:hypothetical protein